MLYLDADWVTSVLQENGADRAQARPRPDLPDETLHARLTELNGVLFGQSHDADKENALLLFVGDCFMPQATHPPHTAPHSALVRVKTLIEDRLTDTLPLDELAAEARMSRYQLLRAFRESFGMTPHAWQLDRRIQHARRLLDREMPLAEIAIHLGFADQSHFQRAFKQRVAATPGEYRSMIDPKVF